MIKSKCFKIELYELTLCEELNKNGEFVFNIYTSNELADDFYEAIMETAAIWNSVNHHEVSLKINMRLKSIFEEMLSCYVTENEVDEEDAPLFKALLNDCQWIINEINKLKF